MARLPYLDPADLPAEHRALLARPINLYRQLAQSPGALRAASPLGRYIRHESKIDPRLRELAILQVGWLARSPYEWSHHVKIGFDYGVSEADIRALVEDSAGRPNDLDALARTVLRGAREITLEGEIGSATFAELQEALGNDGVVDLVVTVSYYNCVVRILASLQIDVEPDYADYLVRFPLPQ